MKKEYYNISHFAEMVAPTHLNYRLAGSVPQSVLSKLRDAKAEWITALESRLIELPDNLSHEIYEREMHRINLRYELELDNYLDGATNGPYHLAHSEIAETVLQSLYTLEQWNEIKLYAACIMSNHVHALIGCPNDVESLDLANLLRRHKTYTAREANKILNATGSDFWDDSYFDRYVRKGKFEKVVKYVLENPVKAGLVKNWQEWPHTYLHLSLAKYF